MKKISLVILLFTSMSYSFNDITVPVTFTDSSVIEAADFNTDFQHFRDYINGLLDSLELKFCRFSDVKDSTFQKIKADTLRSNPDVDSLKGNPFIDSVKTLYLEANKVDLNGGSADGVIIGANAPEDATFDSSYMRALRVQSMSLDSFRVNDTGAVVCTVSTGFSSGGSFSGTDTIGVLRWRRTNNLISVIIEDLSITLTGMLWIKHYPTTIKPAYSGYGINVPTAFYAGKGGVVSFMIPLENGDPEVNGVTVNAHESGAAIQYLTFTYPLTR